MLALLGAPAFLSTCAVRGAITKGSGTSLTMAPTEAWQFWSMIAHEHARSVLSAIERKDPGGRARPYPALLADEEQGTQIEASGQFEVGLFHSPPGIYPYGKGADPEARPGAGSRRDRPAASSMLEKITDGPLEPLMSALSGPHKCTSML